MKNLCLLAFAFAIGTSASAQSPSPTPAGSVATSYRATVAKVNDLVHTKLDVRFDYAKRYLYGKEWVTLKPHGYATDSLRLDAKGMDIKTVALVQNSKQQPLKYDYDQQQLLIHLGRTMKVGESYTIYLEYTAKPDELEAKGSAAISDARGLYFINPDSTVKGKPVQIWTQGESESNSAWFPTIDKPNQKTTTELSMTVPSKYVTLSNGKMVSQTPAGAGLRTDTWKMDQPYAPYLVMMAIGDFKIAKEQWRGKEVSYYMEPQYTAQAQRIFGRTPQMLEFFSNKLGVEFPWNKYAQVVVRDYVSGAMENTTASLFGEQAQGTARELLDWEYAGVEREIAHELFHHWFGDYVTCESWSNLTVNESFANFCETVWAEHAFGTDAAESQGFRSLSTYFRNPANYTKPLVRFQYADKEDMFDAVTYQKGGNILNMLRVYLGDDVFFKGLNLYLKQNAYGNGEAQQVRLALEEASGQDLNWFFNQWYYRAGHPIVTIDYRWDAARKMEEVTIKQTQAGQPFILPLKVDVYMNGKPERHTVWLRDAVTTLQLPAASKPDLVNVDAEKVLVWQKTDNKSLAEYAYQYAHAPRYLDRFEALKASKEKQTEKLARQTVVAGLSDRFYNIRVAAIENLDLKNKATRKAAAPALQKLASADSSVKVQVEALRALAELKDKRYEKTFAQALGSQSYAVQGAALEGLASVDIKDALARANALQADTKGALTAAIVGVYGKSGEVSKWPFVLARFDAASTNDRFNMMQGFAELLERLQDPAAFAEGVSRIQHMGVQFKPYGVDKRLLALLESLKAKRTDNAAAQQVVDQAISAIQAAK
ncbi:M1 family aminopeptidase [Hymenobacter sp. GOD-10R]|uniref:M1 family aminopeptidase n=1 Tax=Hymenobacter sp. GOD-10R TaxID=3093922 RepID=UPI002D788A1B|nr:M1 family aminopeptidase [Hymenobacter sp. GOD-10R]WRQ30532.1 M1 family aminopeptidase [Hymenobacter sp. GOD-10R]